MTIRILLVEDTKVYQQYLTDMLSNERDLSVVGVAENGQEAIRQVQVLRPDIVVMDIHMPEMDGIAATQIIMETNPVPIIIISSAENVKDMNLSIRALSMGAMALLEKPAGIPTKLFPPLYLKLVHMIRALADVKPIRRRSLQRQVGARNSTPDDVIPKIVAIAASTGGPQALKVILKNLTPDFPAPILLVQHIGPQFLTGFAQWLGSVTRLQVVISRNEQEILPGVVYLSPENHHMGLGRLDAIQLSTRDPIQGFRPSADYLLGSVAEVAGADAAGIVLTGMGSDGALGAKRLKAAGGEVLVQDEHTAVVFGMPKATIAENAATRILPLPDIADYLARLNKY